MEYSVNQFKGVLNGLGYNLGPDGLNGNHGNLIDCYTQAAIQEFQVRYNLLVTGELDQATQEKAKQVVRNLQHSLNLTVNAHLPINEFYGLHTTRAVQHFQQEQGLPMTGIANPVVRRKLDEAVKRQLRQQVNRVQQDETLLQFA